MAGRVVWHPSKVSPQVGICDAPRNKQESIMTLGNLQQIDLSFDIVLILYRH